MPGWPAKSRWIGPKWASGGIWGLISIRRQASSARNAVITTRTENTHRKRLGKAWLTEAMGHLLLIDNRYIYRQSIKVKGAVGGQLANGVRRVRPTLSGLRPAL